MKTPPSLWNVKQVTFLVMLWLTGVACPNASNAASPANTGPETASQKPSVVSESPDVEFLGMTAFAGDAIDGSGLNAKLEDRSPANRLGGFSAMEYTGEDDRFVLLADRGAGDGAVSFPCRMHSIDLRIDNEARTIENQFATTTLLTAPDSLPLNGSAATSLIDRSQSADQMWHAMDPEGIRRWKGGFLISDEYGPHLGTFDLNGQMTGQWKLPPSRSHGTIANTPGAGERVCGCFDNKGLEGLAVTPSATSVWASFQSSLLQDGELVESRCRGDLVRWIAFNPDGQRIREVAYPLENRKSGISELLAVDEDRMLVLERDSKGGEKAEVKKIFLASLGGASDVISVDSLPANKDNLLGATDSIQLVQKQLLIDLLDWQEELGDAATAEKPEGLAWGQPLQDGRRTLWICWDNDFDPKRRSYIACFAVDIE